MLAHSTDADDALLTIHYSRMPLGQDSRPTRKTRLFLGFCTPTAASFCWHSSNANQSYLQEGVAILELANRAAELFEKQSASEKRRLLDFVLSNSSWGNGELTVEFRQPFDLIAVAATELKQKKAAGVDSDDLHQFKYTPEDSNL